MVENPHTLYHIGMDVGNEEYLPTIEKEIPRFRSNWRSRYWLINQTTTVILSKWDIGLNKSGLTAGYLLKHEKEILYRVEAQDGASKMCLQVTNWALLLIREGRDAGYFENPSDATRLFEPVLAFKKSCSSVLKFQSTPIPLSFIQV